MSRLISATKVEVIERIVSAHQRESAGPGGKHVLVACLPKSGSTYLSNILSALPEFERANLTFGFGRREQELCIFTCAAMHGINYVAQHHVRYSQSTDDIMKSFGIFPVILMRNFYDCVVSARDQFCIGEMEGPVAYVEPSFTSWPAEKQYDFIIDMALPWYGNFVASWSDYKGPAARVYYSDLIRSPREVISQIAQAAGITVSAVDIETAITNGGADKASSRFNVGRIGRGMEQLNKRQIARIQALFSVYSSIPEFERLLKPPH